MKSKILILLFLVTTLASQAQTKIGFTAGAQLSNVRIIDFNTDNRLGFNVGFSSLMPVSEGVDFNMQLVLSGKGYIYYDSYGYKNIIRPLYLELPLTIRFNFQSTKNTKIFIGGGGYFAYGIGGNKIYHISGYKETQSINFGSTYDDDFEAYDLGLVFQLGAKFRENYEGQFFYDMGLKKITPGTTANSFNRVFGFNLTWYF